MTTMTMTLALRKRMTISGSKINWKDSTRMQSVVEGTFQLRRSRRHPRREDTIRQHPKATSNGRHKADKIQIVPTSKASCSSAVSGTRSSFRSFSYADWLSSTSQTTQVASWLTPYATGYHNHSPCSTSKYWSNGLIASHTKPIFPKLQNEDLTTTKPSFGSYESRRSL